MRYVFVMLCLLFGPVTSAKAQVHVGIQYSIPGVSIGINVGDYPQLVRVPDYPVYYAPNVGFNLFFYDGLYWAYHGDIWYASHWYNGPWGRADHYAVPYFILRVPVRYYRAPPPYFRGWHHNAPPRWGHHWGPQWEQRHRGWDKWDSRAAPRPAPLPTYQRQYSGNRYPRAEQQHELHNKSYRYQPRETVTRETYKQHSAKGTPQTSQRQERGASQQQRPPQTTQQQERGAPQEKGGGNKGNQRADQSPPRPHPQQGPGPQQKGPGAQPQYHPQGKGAPHDPRQQQNKNHNNDRGKGQAKGQDHGGGGGGKGQDHNR